ncbi:MAG: hypothetical protein ACPL7B_10940 [Candidatus Poribacteria bacterium]
MSWIIVFIILLVTVSLSPIIWNGLETFNPSDNYRLPYELSYDYWMFSRWCKYACSNYSIVMIGDSVVWGQYVKLKETLPYYLNEYYGKDISEKQNNKFANLGLDGIHPSAMLGLIKYYGKSISNKQVILHLNPLWMSSKKHDLSDTEEFRFNHPRLVPQFRPKITSYKAKFHQKANIILERNIPFSSWVNHIRLNYYENMDIGNWTMQYPYRNPFSAITFQIPEPEDNPHSEPISWIERGMTKQDFSWVSLDESFQWNFFKKVIKLLQARKNKVFVIIGPFNPYILTDESLNKYKAIKNDIENWLKSEGISYASPSDLPSEYYADASHPLNVGYEIIAKELVETESFKDWLKN